MKEKAVLLLIWGALIFCILRVEYALADTLEPQDCTYLSPTSGVCAFPDGYLSFNASTTVLVWGGVSYTGAGFTGGYQDAVLYADDGSSATLTAVITPHKKYVSAGRAHYYRYWWTLDSGSVQ